MSKTVFITGGTSGLGLELTKIYLSKGHRVGVCGFATSASEELKTCPNFEFFELDVTNRELLISTVTEFARGKLDLMIASAGINSAYERVDLPNFDREKKIFEVNTLGTLYAIEAALPLMTPHRSGQIAAIASASGLSGFPGNAGYTASKAAVFKLCEAYAIDFARYGITVSVLGPGFVSTPLTKNNPDKMPFIQTPEVAAKKIARAIENKREYYLFPFAAYFVMTFLAHLPRWIYRALYRRVFAKKMRSAGFK